LELLPALLILLSITIKLIIVSLFYSICLLLNSAAHDVTNTPKFHHITPIIKSPLWLKINDRIKYKVFSLTSGQPSCLRSLLSLHIVLLGLLLLSTFVALLSPLFSNCKQILLSFCSCFVEQSPISTTSRCSPRHSFIYIKLTCLWSFNLSLKKVKNPSL